MNRACLAAAAALAAVTLAGAAPSAQTPKAPEFKTVLSGKKVEPPLKGQVEVEYMTPVTKRNGDVVTTTIRVKNVSQGPIARLSISETWFDKGGASVGGSQGALDKILDAGGVATVTIQTPWNAKMNGNSWTFTHANGTVKPRRVAKLDEGKAPVATAAAKKK